MRTMLRFSVPLWTLLVFSALIKSSQAECNGSSNTTCPPETVPTTQTDVTSASVYSSTSLTTDSSMGVTMKPKAVRNLSVTGTSTSSIFVNWTEPEGSSSFYRVKWMDGMATRNETVTVTELNITGLTAGSRYAISVSAVADDNVTEGAPVTVTGYTKPQVVINLTVTETSTSSVSLTWTEPVGSSSFYRVQWTDGTTSWNETVTETELNITGLTPGVLYTIKVSAVADDNVTEGTALTVPVFTRPQVVRNLSVTETSTSSVSLTWTEPVGSSSFYRVQWTDGTTSGNETVTETERNITGLTPGVLYTISVSAVADDNVTEGAPDARSRYTKPEVVRNLSVTETSTSSVSLTWTEPVGSSSFYRVQWTDGTTSWIETVTETERNITGLTPGVLYTFSVSAVADDNVTEGAPDTRSRYTKPEVVRNLNVTDFTTSSVSVSWSKPEGNSSFYRVQWTGGNINESINESETFTVITNLTSGVQYTITVTAVAQDGYTEGQSTSVYQYTKPEVVRNLSVTETSTSSVSLTWTEPVGSSSFYRVQWTDGTTSWIETVTETERNITGLTPGVLYTFSVSAVADDNVTEGAPDTRSHYTKPEVVRNLNVTDFTTSSVSVSWSKPEGNSSFYRVQWAGGNINESINESETFTVITNLTSGVQYTITVTAVAQDGYTEGQSTSVYQYTKPEVVRNLSVTETSTSSVSLTWTEPVGSSSFYRVQWTDGTTSWIETVTETERNITGLTPGVLYTFSVSAVADDNVTEGAPDTRSHYTKPEVVRNLNVTDFTTSSVSVSWSKPEGNSSFYRVQWTGGNINESINESETFTAITNLTSGVQYTITVTAVAQDGYTEGQSTSVYQYTKPEVVRNLSVTETSTSSVSLTWTEPVGSSSFYRVQWTDGTTSWIETVTETERNITGLTPGVLYTFSVSAVADDNVTEGAPDTRSRYTKPEVVRTLNVTDFTTSSVSVSWSKPEGNSSFYRVQWAGGNINESINESETFTVITNLTSGVQYTITVTAVAQDGYTEGQSTSVYQYTKPGVVRNLSVTATSTSSVSLTWTEPVGSSSFYRVQWTDGTTSWIETVTETERNITGLTPGVLYTFSVSAVADDNVTEGAPDTRSRYTKPEVVRNLNVTDFTTSSVSVSWSKPEGNSSFYRVQWTGGNINESINESETFTVITNLTSGVQYTITVTAVAQDGYTEGQSTSVYQYTKPEVVRNLSVTETSTSSVSLTWTEPVGSSSFYRVQWTDGTTSWIETVTETERNITGLTPGVLYTFSVSAVADDNVTEGAPDTRSRYTKPEVVRNLNVTDFTTSSVSVSWSKPEGNSSFYRVQWTGGNINESINKSETFTVITNLTSGVQYTITVTAVAQDGYTEGQSTSVYQYTKPEVVRNLSVTETSTSSVSLTWTEPVGSSSFYRVQWTDGTTSWIETVTETERNITGLTPGVLYTFSVSAVADDNVTEGAPDTRSRYTKPEVVRNLNVTDFTTSSVSVSWSKPEGNSSFYRVQWTGGNINESINKSETFTVITNLTSGVQYTITVTAVAQDGYTEGQSTSVYQYTKPEVVSDLTVTGITTSSVSLKWTEPKGNSYFYRVQWTGGNLSHVKDTNITINGLTAGVQYEFNVSAVAGDEKTIGEGAVVSCYTKPEQVGNLSVTDITTSSVSVNWTKPEGNSYFYRVQWTGGEINKTVNEFETFKVIHSLIPGVQYTINVTAVAHDNHTEGQSTSVSQYTKPDKIEKIDSSSTTTSISLNWTSPPGEVFAYMVMWEDAGPPKTLNVNSTSVELSGLIPGTNYTITVTTVAGDNETKGAPHIISSFTRPEKPFNIMGDAIGTSRLNISWFLPSGRVDHYVVNITNTDVPYNNFTETEHTTALFTHLYSGRLFVVTVTAVAGSFINTSDQFSFATAPTPPGSLIFSHRTNSSLQLEWTTPAMMDNAVSISYYITYQREGGNIETKNATEKNIELSELWSGYSYNITVQTVGPQNLMSTAIYNSTFTRPNPVMNLRASPESITSVKVEWSGPLGVQQYYKYWAEIYTDTETLINSTYIYNSSTVNNLEPGTRYNISVKTEASPGIYSTVEQTFAYTKPKAVTNLTVVNISTTEIMVKWLRQSDHKPSYYYLVKAWQGSVVVHDNSTSMENYTFYDLDPGTHYKFDVITVIADVQSEVMTTESYTNPEAVSSITAIGTTTNLSVSWTPVGTQVSFYSVLLYNDEQLEQNRTDLSNTTTNTLFVNLKPGVLYCVKVVTKSGPLENWSQHLCNATFPNPPGSITVGPQTVKSIRFTWHHPEDMDHRQYNFSVSIINDSIVTENDTYLLEDVESGSPYRISVVTVGVLGYKSTAVTAEGYTRPYPITNLRAREITVNAVTLVWEQRESKSSYSYEVWFYNESSLSHSEVNTTETKISGLVSGSNYSFVVTARAADGTEAPENVTRSYFTRPYWVSGLRAETLNTTDIRLSWEKPQEYKSDYRYLITTTECADYSRTESNETAVMTSLTAGTNCNFSVAVMAANGITGDEEHISQYTKPEKGQPTVLSFSNSSILVSWSKPQGNAEEYKVYMNGSVSGSTGMLNSSTTSYLFENLTAGRSYSFRLITKSGPFNASSDVVTNATYPNPPGQIEILMKKTDSIEITWGEAPQMSQGLFHYELTITPSKEKEISVTINNYTFPSLSSGTSHNISVATVGQMGFKSSKSYSLMVTTRPLSVDSLTAISEETHLNVTWTKPVDYKDGYHYRLTWNPVNGDKIQSSSLLDETQYIISKLIPGSRYDFNLTTVTSDGTESAAKINSSVTNAAPVKDLNCVGPNKTNAEIILSWIRPEGQFSGFSFTVNDGESIPSSTCCDYTVPNLKHHTKYTLTVRTESYGQPSIPTKAECQTGITNPAISLDYDTFVTVTQKRHNRFSLQIDTALFNDSNGPVTHFGVLVTSNNQDSGTNLTEYLVSTYEKFKAKKTPAYLATIVARRQPRSRSRQSHLNVTIGDKTKWESYFNGPLDAQGSYRFSIVVFSSLQTDKGYVDLSSSLYTVTLIHSIEVDLPQNPVVINISIGATLGIFCILFIILIGFIIYWKRVTKNESPDIQIESLGAKVSVEVTVEDYEAYFKKQKADSNCGFAEEFEDLKVVGTGQAKIHASHVENKPKNRYNNVLPYDSSRVKLSIIHGSPYDDYINANYMPGYNSRKEFIAAQGPLPTTVKDFWRMIWEKNVQTLVMLTRCNEQGRVKCEQYWESGTKHYDNITVTTTSEIPLDDWIIRDFDIKNVKTAETRSVRHFHFTAWPDHGVPETTELLISFRHLVREHMNQYSRHSPTVVHCSAGVGRTGTFIAIDRLLFQIERENKVDVYGIVHDLRMHRPLMVQTEDQYVFLNQCALDIIRSRTGTNVDLIYQNAAALSIYENIEPAKRFLH
ncbi:receptor-type tyrosine-protein phosphatase beta-like [Pholidichthys leucotaenia]